MSLRIEITRPKTCKDEIINGIIEVDNVQYPITITPITFMQMKTAGLIFIPVNNKLISNVFDIIDDLPF